MMHWSTKVILAADIMRKLTMRYGECNSSANEATLRKKHRARHNLLWKVIMMNLSKTSLGQKTFLLSLSEKFRFDVNKRRGAGSVKREKGGFSLDRV